MGIRDIWDRAVHPQCVVVKKKPTPQSLWDTRKAYGSALSIVVGPAVGWVIGPLPIVFGGAIGSVCSLIFISTIKNRNLANKLTKTSAAMMALSLAGCITQFTIYDKMEQKDIPQQVRTDLLEEIKKGKTEVFGSITCEIDDAWSWDKKNLKKEISITASPNTNVSPTKIGVSEDIAYTSISSDFKKIQHADYEILIDQDVRAAIFAKLAKDAKQVRVYDKKL